MTRIWRRRLLFSALGVAALAGLAALLRPAPVPVETAGVERGHFEQTIEEDGKTRVRDRYVVSAPVAGRLLRIDLEAGDAVENGMVLATILPTPSPMLDPRARQEQEQRVGAAEASLLRAEVATTRAREAHEQAQADLARSRTLAPRGVIPQSRLEQDELAAKLAVRDLEVAEFEQEVAAHQLELARTALQHLDSNGSAEAVERWVIRSPVAGRVLRVLQESEGIVPLGTPLIEIADPANIEIVVDLLTTDAVQIPAGAPARIEGWGGTGPLDGRVRMVEPGAFTKISALGVEEQRTNVIIDIVSPAEAWQGLGDGYRVEARIVLFEAEDAVTIPTGALFRKNGGWAVFVVVDGVAQERTVQVGRRGELRAMIESGLEPGETVVLYPGDAVADDVRVRPQ